MKVAPYPSLASQEWSNLFWALATVKHQPPRELVDVLYDTVRDTSWAAAEQAWCNVLWALAVLDLYEERLVSWIAHGAAQVGARRLTVTSLTNSLWALASMPDGAMAAQVRGWRVVLMDSAPYCN